MKNKSLLLLFYVLEIFAHSRENGGLRLGSTKSATRWLKEERGNNKEEIIKL